MKPLVVSLGLYKSSGGPSKTVASFLQALDAPLLSFVDPKKRNKEEIAIPDSQVVEACSLPFFRQFCLPPRKIQKSLEENISEVDLISCHSFYRFHTMWVNRMFRKYGVPYWFVPHGGLDPYVMESGKVAKRLYLMFGGRRFLRNAGCIIFATEAEWRKAEVIFGPLEGRVIPWPVSPSGIDDEEKAQMRRSVRAELSIPENDPVLIYFGRIHSMKRPLETIEAVNSVDPGNLHLIVVGPDGDQTAEDCERKARECGYKRLHVVGPCYGKEKSKVIAAADAYISLSHRENFNHAAAECLALGIPVLLSEGNDLKSFVIESNSGWVSTGDQPEDFEKLVEDFLKSESPHWKSKGSNGIRLVNEQFSFAKFRESIQRVKKEFSRS